MPRSVRHRADGSRVGIWVWMAGGVLAGLLLKNGVLWHGGPVFLVVGACSAGLATAGILGWKLLAGPFRRRPERSHNAGVAGVAADTV